VVAPADGNVVTQGWSFLDESHMPGMTYYPYVLTGEPQFMDLVAEYANAGLYTMYTPGGTAVVSDTENFIGATRNATIDGNAYHGVFFGDDLLRAIAWPIRDIAAAQILPDSNPENASYNSYFSDVLSDIYDGYNAYIGMLSAGADPYVTDNGLFLEDSNGAGGIQESWTMGYLISSVNLAYGLSKSSSSLEFLNYLLKWPSHLYSSFGVWAIPYYQAMGRKNGASCAAGACRTPYIDSDDQFAVYGYNLTWSSGTGIFTLQSIPSANYLLANDDVFMWNGAIEGAPPAGFSGENVRYFVVNKSGSGGVGTTFQLSDSLGGAPLTLTDTQASSRHVYGMPAVRPAGYVGDTGGFSASGYLANLTANIGWAKAVGATVDASMLSDLQALVSGSSGYVAAYESDPKYAMTDSY
jgi:hypothetical protein